VEENLDPEHPPRDGGTPRAEALHFLPRSSSAFDKSWVTTLSLQAVGQRIGSVHLVEKLCSFYLLSH
jgi:hypothetical protein